MSGGGPAVGLLEYGVLKEFTKKELLQYENIKSLYTTSVGSIIGLIYILNYDWDWIDDFFIKRPWEKLLNLESNEFLNLFNTKGLLDETFILNVIKPLLLGKDLSINISLKELYDYSNIDFYIYSTKLIDFSKIEISYKTHPDLSVITAIYMSCCIPILFKPAYYNNDYYLDGGICVNNPMNECLVNENCSINEILLLINNKKNPIDCSNNFYINNNYNLYNNDNFYDLSSLNIFNYLIYIIKKILNKITTFELENIIESKFTINIALTFESIDLNYWF